MTNRTIKRAIPRNTKIKAKKANKFFKTAFPNNKDNIYETNANAKKTIKFLTTNPTLVFIGLEDFLEICLLVALLALFTLLFFAIIYNMIYSF